MAQTEKAVIELQDGVLETLAPLSGDDCVLTGGTALVRFHGFLHRLSDDLDLFLFAPDEDRIRDWFRELAEKGLHVEVLGRSDPPALFGLHCLVSRPVSPQAVRVDFVEDPFSGAWLPLWMRARDTGVRFRVDPLEAILHKKLYAVYSCAMRNEPPRTKDIVDLYVLFRDVFDLETVRKFYRDARDIVLPLETVLKIVSEANLDPEEIRAREPDLLERTQQWQEELKKRPAFPSLGPAPGDLRPK